MYALRFLIANVMFLALFYGLPGEASARDWRKNPTTEAFNYIWINDERSDAETVSIIWVAPEIFPLDPETEPVRLLMNEYTLVGIVHVRTSDFGEVTFETPTRVTVKIDKNEPLEPLPQGSIPPC